MTFTTQLVYLFSFIISLERKHEVINAVLKSLNKLNDTKMPFFIIEEPTLNAYKTT